MSAVSAIARGLGAPGLALILGACATAPAEPPTGAQVFETHCAACHGPRGEGDGPVAPTLRVPVPNLRTLNERYGGDFPADEVASYIDGRDLPQAHGERYMPVWGVIFEVTRDVVPDAQDPETRIEALIAYLRTLQYP